VGALDGYYIPKCCAKAMGSGGQGIETGFGIEHVGTGFHRIGVGTACTGNSWLRENRVRIGLGEFRFATHTLICIETGLLI
jgi:hypothetical protein